MKRRDHDVILVMKLAASREEAIKVLVSFASSHMMS